MQQISTGYEIPRGTSMLINKFGHTQPNLVFINGHIRNFISFCHLNKKLNLKHLVVIILNNLIFNLCKFINVPMFDRPGVWCRVVAECPIHNF